MRHDPIPTAAVPRVAMVSDYVPGTLGRAGNAFAAYVRAAAESTDVLAVCPPSRRSSELGHHPRVRYLALPPAFVVPGLGFSLTRHTPRLRAMLRRAFLSAGTDIVHVHSDLGAGAAGVAAADELGIPVLRTGTAPPPGTY